MYSAMRTTQHGGSAESFVGTLLVVLPHPVARSARSGLLLLYLIASVVISYLSALVVGVIFSKFVLLQPI